MSCSQLHSEHVLPWLQVLMASSTALSGSRWGSGGQAPFGSGSTWVIGFLLQGHLGTKPDAQELSKPTALWSTSEGRGIPCWRNKVWPPGGTESHFRILQGLRNHTGACDRKLGDLNKQRFQSLAVVCGS